MDGWYFIEGVAVFVLAILATHAIDRFADALAQRRNGAARERAGE